MIAVTGAAGFVGRRVCALLEREGAPCLALDRDTCDITDAAAVLRLFQSHEVAGVIHLAALLPSASRADPELATRINIGGSANVLEAAAACGARRFVFGSSASVHLPQDLYGAAKRYVEIYGNLLARSRGLEFTALRLATVVGPGARSSTSGWRSDMFERRRIVLPFSDADTLALLHVEDAARLLVLLAASRRAPAPVYESPAENWPVAELKRALEALGPGIRVELDARQRRTPPPAPDASAFCHDFEYRLPPLAPRLSENRYRTE